MMWVGMRSWKILSAPREPLLQCSQQHTAVSSMLSRLNSQNPDLAGGGGGGSWVRGFWGCDASLRRVHTR